MFKQIDYTMVIVSDMQRSVEFYRDKLGIPLKFQSPEWTEFQTGTTTLALHGGGVASTTPPTGDPGKQATPRAATDGRRDVLGPHVSSVVSSNRRHSRRPNGQERYVRGFCLNLRDPAADIR